MKLETKVVTINIPVQVGHESWVKCWEKASNQASLFGTQEAFNRRQKRTYKRLCREHNWGKAGMGGPNPVFFNKTVWRKISSHVIRIHDADKGPHTKNRPGFHAARFMTEAVLHNIEYGYDAAVLNVHWVPEQIVTKSFKRKSRRASKKILRQRVKYHTRMGRVVFVMGDTNIYKKIRIGAVKWMRALGIDKLGVAVPKNMIIESATYRMFSAPTDHKRGICGMLTVTLMSA